MCNLPLMFAFSIGISGNKAKNDRARRLGCATDSVAWLGLAAYAVLLWQGTVASEASCPASSFEPSPGYNGSRIVRWNAPAVELVECASTAGALHLHLRREWAPIGVQHFLALVESGFFTDVALFRVIPAFVCQFGASEDSSANQRWARPIADDVPPLKKVPFERGTLSFAGNGPDSRSTQLFFGLIEDGAEDVRLGKAPWETPIGRLAEDTLETLEGVYTGYGESWPRGNGPESGRIQQEGNEYLRRQYPELDYIQSCAVVSDTEVNVARCGPSVAPFAAAAAVVVSITSWLMMTSAGLAKPKPGIGAPRP